MSKLTDMLRAQFECDHENPDCPKTVEVDCDQLGESIIILCELYDMVERARDKAFAECDTLAKRVEALEGWIVWCSKASFPLGALSDKAGEIITTRRAGREKT